MESVQDPACTSLRADAQEFFPIANGAGPRRQLFRHASDQISRLPYISETSGQVRTYLSSILGRACVRQDNRRQAANIGVSQIVCHHFCAGQPVQTYRGRLPQVQIESQKTLNRLDAGNPVPQMSHALSSCFNHECFLCALLHAKSFTGCESGNNTHLFTLKYGRAILIDSCALWQCHSPLAMECSRQRRATWQCSGIRFIQEHP